LLERTGTTEQQAPELSAPPAAPAETPVPQAEPPAPTTTPKDDSKQEGKTP
jgi:hypothetical protein